MLWVKESKRKTAMLLTNQFDSLFVFNVFLYYCFACFCCCLWYLLLLICIFVFCTFYFYYFFCCCCWINNDNDILTYHWKCSQLIVCHFIFILFACNESTFWRRTTTEKMTLLFCEEEKKKTRLNYYYVLFIMHSRYTWNGHSNFRWESKTIFIFSFCFVFIKNT